MPTTTITGTAVTASGGTTYSALKTYARLRIGNSATSNATTIIGSAINNAIKRVGREDFYYFLNWGRFNLVNKYTTGTVTTVTGSSTITGTATAWVAGGIASRDKMIIAGDTNAEMDIQTIGGATSITLYGDHKWIETAVSNAAYTIYRDSFALPTSSGLKFRKMYNPEGEDFGIYWISPSEFTEYKLANKNISSSTPEFGTVIKDRIYLYPYPTVAAVVDYLYYAWPKELSADGDTIDLDESFLPLLHRAIDVELSLFPGVELNPAEMLGMYERFLADFMDADRKCWKSLKISNPSWQTAQYSGTRTRRAALVRGTVSIS
jgi:hypothetical protein